MTPGPWLRLLALASTAGVAAVVATGEWGLAHDVVANITLVLLAAVSRSSTMMRGFVSVR